MKALAQECIRNEKISHLDKKDAAQQQLEGAIFSLFMDNWASAITLAGAAEDILPPLVAGEDFIQAVKSKGAEQFGFTEKEVVEYFNKRRNWLKQHQTGQPNFAPTMDFKQDDAVEMIFRASLKFQLTFRGVSPVMQIFVDWFSAHYSDWMQPLPFPSLGHTQ